MNCCFIGHHDAPISIEAPLFAEIERLIVEHGVTGFYVGNHGAFDRMVLSALRKIKQKHEQIEFHIVLAYLPGEKGIHTPYAELKTVLPDGIETVPRRYAISYRNKWMVNRCEYMIAYVQHHFGGAAQFMELAERQGKHIINLGETK